MTTLNPEILQWARNTAGLSAEQAARALDFKNTRDRSAEQRLMALEAGNEQPSRNVLQKMAKAYRRSLLVFYLAHPPRTADRGQDFRTVPGVAPQYNPILDALIRDIRGRQTLVRSLLEDDEPQLLKFVGAASINDAPQELGDRVKANIQFSLDEFRRQPTVERAFSYLRQKIEATGVFVLLFGNLGSHHTNIPAETFRGFVIADVLAPFIVINDQDAHAAWAFTALHELVHLWLGTTGISGESAEASIEKYCNDVASEILLPAAELKALAALRKTPIAEAATVISAFASARKISRSLVAYKLLRADVISQTSWGQLADHFRVEWVESRKKQDEDHHGEGGGPSYYVLKRHRLGNAIIDLTRRSLSEATITYTKAAQLLGVKARNVDPLIHGVGSEVRGG